jgi:dCMP deaminase
LTCSIKITQVGISEVVYSQSYSMDGETASVFKEAGVRLRQFVPVRSSGPFHKEITANQYSLPTE